VLDNLEQIEGIGPAVRQMLERSPDLQVLATSRRALRVGGEQELPVLPLPPPREDAGEPLGHQPAIELFVDRARSVDLGFSPDAAGLDAIAELCRRVDGLPLAIELAAARVRLLAPQEILRRLRSGFELLSSKSADRPARQQTLRATLDWSYELLSPGERSLLARLAVFEGSFSLEAATAVCGGGPVNVVDDLTGLLDSSLILPFEEPELVEPRFHMLQTVHGYAADRLARSGEADLIRKRFTAWLLQLSDRAAPFLCGPHQRDWAARFDAERANLRAAVRAALDAGDFKSTIELVWNVFVFYRIRDANAEPRDWIRETVAARPALDTVTEARLRLMDVQVRTATGDFDGAAEALVFAGDVFTAQDLRLEAAVTFMVWSDVHLHLNSDLAEAGAALQKSMQLFASVDHDWGIALTQIGMSLLHWMNGNTEAARDCLNDSLVHSRRIENEPQIARALSLLAMLGPDTGSGAISLLRDAAAIVVRGRYRAEAAACLEALALSSHLAGREAEACKAASLSSRLRDQLQLPRPLPLVGALSAAGLLGARPDSVPRPLTDAPFAFLAEVLLTPAPPPAPRAV
jgi:predicted ATPase